jgi:putative membrane protein
MALFVLILLLEIRPMVTLIRWRVRLGRGETVDSSAALALYTLNHIELALVVVTVFAASLMARGIGFS